MQKYCAVKNTIIVTWPMIIRCRQRSHWSWTLGVSLPYFGLGLAFCGLGLGLEAYGLVNITAY